MSREFKISIVIVFVACLFSVGFITIFRHGIRRESDQIAGTRDDQNIPPLPSMPHLSEICTPASQKIV